MTNCFFERDIFSELLKWAKTSTRGLFLRGPRQVGKTSVLLKLGETDFFSGCLYIDLRSPESRAWWERDKNGLRWYERFQQFSKAFKSSVIFGDPFNEESKPLVILDEIQESPKMFNSIRDIVNEQNVKLAATGSYLGIAEFENRFSSLGQPYFMPVGNVELLEMGTLTYREALHACNQFMPKLSRTVIFERYFQFGGYPAVVKDWMQMDGGNDCTATLQHIYAILQREAQRYIQEPLPQSVWDLMFVGVAQQIDRKGDILQNYDQELTYKLRIPDTNAASRDNKISMMYWMLSCDLLISGIVTNNLNKLDNIVKRSYYFADQGLLFLALANSTLYPSLPINRGNMSGILAENFVALALKEHMVPLSYVKGNTEEIDFLYQSPTDTRPDAFEVKFSGGKTISSDKALSDGKVKRIIKIQRDIEQSTDTTIIYPMEDMDKFGEFLGYPKEHNRYVFPDLDIF